MKATLSTGFAVLLVLTAYAGEIAGRKMAWAHYVPWFKPENASIDAGGFYNFPLTHVDERESRDVSTRREIELAMANGIDGWFVDLGANTKNGTMNSSWDMPGYLNAASGTAFQVGICLDGIAPSNYFAREVIRLLKAFGEHPNYPKENGRPVVCTYSFLENGTNVWNETVRLAREAGFDIYLIANVNPMPWKSIEFAKFEPCADAFQAAYMFSAPGHANDPPEKTNRELHEWCAAHGKRAIPTLHPGYWGAWLKGYNDFYHSFRGMDMLYRTYTAGRAAGPADWVHVTTWNDLAETALLPCVFTPGAARLMHAYCDGLKGRYIAAPETRINLAYRREEIVGTMWRMEAMALPKRGGNDVTISGELIGSDGRKVFDLVPRRLEGDGFARCEWLVPTAALSEHMSLTPDIRVAEGGRVRRVSLPSVLLVSGWIQNAVTVNVALEGMLLDVHPTLSVSQEDDVLSASLAVLAGEPLRSAILFRNDRPYGVLEPSDHARSGEYQRMICLDGIVGDLTLSVTNGRILRAVKNFERNGGPSWQWDEHCLVTRRNPRSGTHGIVVSGGKDLKISWEAKNGARLDDNTLDLTIMNAAPLGIAGGTLSIRRKSPPPRPSDSFWALVETESGKLHYTPTVWPFDAEHRLAERAILETTTSLETSCYCAGLAFRDEPEFLTAANELPVPSNRVVKCKVPAAGSRHAEWKLLDRTGVFELPKRTWPQGTMRIAMRIRPDAATGKRQTLVFKEGFCDGVSMDLTSDGRIELIRGYVVGMKGKSDWMTGQTRLAPERWHDLLVEGDMAEIRLWVDGVLDARMKPTPVRSYDRCRIFIGGGRGCEPFHGGIDTLVIDGV